MDAKKYFCKKYFMNILRINPLQLSIWFQLNPLKDSLVIMLNL